MPHDESQPLPTIPQVGPPDTVHPDDSQPQPPEQPRTILLPNAAEMSRQLSAPDGPTAPPGFELGELIGKGGMGVVYAARDIEFGREVAVKLLRPEYLGHPTAARRFVEEARITGQLQHPGIPAAYRVGTTPDGGPFLAMKLVKGRTLHELLKDSPDRSRLIPVFEGICQAVDYAHAHGVIHRDLKPQNVMVGAFGEVQVMDWGLAKVLPSVEAPARRGSPADTEPLTRIRDSRSEDDATQPGSVLGSPAYMPPEQAIGAVDKIDRQSDVFGLGGVLCAILTGKPPYIADSPESTRQLAAQAKLADAYARLDTCGADPDLIALCKRCLGSEPADRPADANAVATAVADLRAAADERARQAEVERERAAVRTTEERKRRRARMWAVAVLMAVLAAGVVGTTIGLLRADAAAVRERAAAEREKVRADGEAAAKADAIIQRDAAEKSRARTREVLDAMTSTATGDSLERQEAITAEQRKFLEGVLVYYQEFAGDSGTDEASRRQTAAAALRVGRIFSRLGRRDEGVQAYTRARDLSVALAADFPTVPQYRADLATSHNNLGVLLRDRGEGAAAEAASRQGLALREKLAADFPTVPQYRADLAKSHGNLGVLLSGRGEGAAAEAAARQGLALSEKLAADFPTVPQYRRDLAASHNNLGVLLSDRGEGAAAEAAYRQGLALQEKLAADFPTVPEYRAALAKSHNNLGVLLIGRGEGAAAEAAYRNGLALFEKLAADFPTVPEYRANLGGSYGNLGLLVRDAGRPGESLGWFDKAIRTLTPIHEQEPRAVTPRLFLRNSHEGRALALMKLNRHADAVADWDKALALDDGSSRAEIQKQRMICLLRPTPKRELAPPPRAGR